MNPDRLPEALPIDENTCLKKLLLKSSAEIFKAIDRDREYLRRWLPFIDNTRKQEDTENFVKAVLHSNCPKKDLIYEIRTHDEFAGLIALKEIDPWNNKTEIGYWLVQRFERHGLITRSCEALLDLSFNKLGINRVQIKVAVGNARSCLVPERLGFSVEGIERAGEMHQDRYLDLIVYSILKQDWEQRKDQ